MPEGEPGRYRAVHEPQFLLGSDRLGILVGQAERELVFFADQVTAVETERYLTNF